MFYNNKMPTKYDVFAEIIEQSPCKAKDLLFKTPIYAHIKSLILQKWVKQIEGKYIPVKSQTTTLAFKIIKYCLKNGLDYNKFFSRNLPTIITQLFENTPNLRPEKLKGNKENSELMKYLEKNQFILIIKKSPRKGIILKHQLFDSILNLYNIRTLIKTKNYIDIKELILQIKAETINPFDDKIFSFLTGSAQLEGSTVTVGETKELIVNDIYPDKPKKDIQMVKNLDEAMHYVLENLENEISTEHIKELNKLVMFSLYRNAGKYKVTHNKIQGNPNFKTAYPNQVPELMQKYCKILQEIKTKKECLDQTGYIHNELQHIHPFSDGNSRTTRMVLNWMLLKHKLPLLIIKMGCFDEYMGLTKLSKQRKDEKLTKLFQHLLIHEHLIQ